MLRGKFQCLGYVTASDIAGLDELDQLKPEQREMESLILFKYLSTCQTI